MEKSDTTKQPGNIVTAWKVATDTLNNWLLSKKTQCKLSFIPVGGVCNIWVEEDCFTHYIIQ